MLRSDECLQRANDYLRKANEVQRSFRGETPDEIQPLFLKCAESWRALAVVAQLAEGTFTTEFD